MAKQTFTASQVLTAAQMNTLQTNDYNQTVSTKTASYTLVAADAGTKVVMNSASATAITVNTSLFTAGDTLTILNIGAGVCTITAGTATVASAGSLGLATNAGGTLYFTSAGVSIFQTDTVSMGLVKETGATASTAFTAGTPLTVLSLSATIYAGRSYQIFGKLDVQYSTSAATGAALFVTANSVNRTLYYQTEAVPAFFCLGVSGFVLMSATELGVTSGSASKTFELKFKSSAAGSLNTDPDGFISGGSFSQQLLVIDVGAA
jgi:hypothetical protein